MGPRAIRDVSSGESQVSEGQEEEAHGETVTEREVFPETRTPGGVGENHGREDSSQKCWRWREDT